MRVTGDLVWKGARAHLDVDPFLLRKSLVLVLEDPARCHVGLVEGVELSGQEMLKG